MTTSKLMRFGAPYRSKTFNDKENIVFGSNGVISGGEVTQSGMVVTIAAPFTFIQNGLLVTIPDVSLSLTLAAGLVAPYFVAVNVSSSIENLSEVLTPVIVKRPQDVTANVVLVAEYDGIEWRNLPKLQIKERVDAVSNQNVFTGSIGVCSGFSISKDVSNFYVDPGSLIGVDGVGVTKDETTTLSKVAAPFNDSQAYDRIDPIIFRKPSDSSYRVGTIKSVTGPSFVGTSGTYAETPVNFGASQVASPVIKGVIGSTSTVMAYIEGTTLKFILFDADLVPGAPVTVATNVIEFQFTSNFAGTLDFIYTDSVSAQVSLNFLRISTVGAVITGPTVIYTSLKILHHPDIVCIGKTTDYKLHIAVCKEGTGTVREIGYIRIASDGTSIDTPYITWIDYVSKLQNISLAKDDDDSLLFIGFDNDDTGKAYLATYDAGTPTFLSAPTAAALPVELQTEVYNIGAATTMPTSGAKGVKVFRTDNKETFAFWQQPLLTPGEFGIGMYNYRYKQLFGYKSLVFDNTDVLNFSASVDGLNNFYAVTVDLTGTTVTKNVYSLDSMVRIGTQDVVYSGANILSTAVGFCQRGDLLYGIAQTTQGTSLRSTATVKTTLRSQLLPPTDTYLGYYRVSDDMVAISDTLIGEHIAVRRLYDMHNLFGAATNISWNLVGAEKLVTTAITIRFLDRQSTYTIPATAPGGVTVPDGYVYYTEVPDVDETSTLSTFIEAFGDGILDRLGKQAIPLFWNIGGTLYSNFSPHSFSSGGESGPLGSTISNELMLWLGVGTSAPDPTNHGYTSTYYILQTDSDNAALGKLDAAVGAFAPVLLPLTIGTQSVSVVFGTPKASAAFKLIGMLSNVVDTDPMIQPIGTTAKTVNGFTVSWPSPLDSGNYNLEYILHGV